MRLRRGAKVHTVTVPDKKGGRTVTLASAALVNKGDVRSAPGEQKWQKQAWQFYDEVSELRAGVGWLSNALSRIRLYVGEVDPDGSSEPIPVTDDLVQAPLDELFDGQVSQSEMLRRLAIHLNVPGESYVIGFDQEGERRWLCASSEEFTASRDGSAKVRLPESDRQVDLPVGQSTIIRLWRPHPSRAYHADSPVRGLRGVLRRLLGLSSHLDASIDSRLAGAGLLFIPDSISPPAPQETEGGPNPLHTDPLMASLIEAMVTPIQNRESAAAVVPIVLRGPEAAGQAIKHLTFSTPLDQQIPVLEENAIKRLALGLDIPPEILTGLGDVNHWSSWQIESSALKLHVNPLVQLICDALTDAYLRPALEQLGVAAPSRYAFGFDTSNLVVKEDRGPESRELHEKALLSAKAVLREHGFSEDDLPEEDERRELIIQQLLMRAPNLAPVLLPALGIEIEGLELPELAAEEPQAIEPGAGREPNPQEPPDTEPTGGEVLPIAATAGAQPAGSAALWQLRALELAVLRALEHAGNRILSRRPRSARGELAHVPLHEIHAEIGVQQKDLEVILRGAYRELQTVLPDAPCLHQTVDDYVRALIMTGHRHETRYLRMALRQAGCDAA